MAGRDAIRVAPWGGYHAESSGASVRVALAAAIFGGFAISGHLSMVSGLGYPLGAVVIAASTLRFRRRLE